MKNIPTIATGIALVALLANLMLMNVNKKGNLIKNGWN